MATHLLFDGKLRIYLRSGSSIWQCSATVGGHRFRESTKHEDFASAKVFAEDWYLGLRGKLAAGVMTPKAKERTFADASEEYMRQMKVLTISNRSPKYVEGMELRLNAYILPFFRKTPLKDVNKGLIQSYCVQRYEETIAKSGKPPARNTMLHEIVHIRQILKFAEGRGWIPYVPRIDTEFLRQTKKGRRAWFSPEEYKQLYTATRERIEKGVRRGWKTHYEEMHDYILFMANTGMRPDEAKNLEVRDVAVIEDYATKETILDIDVRGKVGVGYAKSMPGAVYPFQRLRSRRLSELQSFHPTASMEELERMLSHVKLFRKFKRALFNNILDKQGLKFDRDGQRRTAYSLRHTYISMRLMEGADIYQIANNCRTSVEMIEQHYAAHIKDRLNTAAINVMRAKPEREAAEKTYRKPKATNDLPLKTVNNPPETER